MNNDIPKYEDTSPVAESDVPKYEETMAHPDEPVSKHETEEDFNNMIGNIPIIGKPLKAGKEFREDLNSSLLRSLVGGAGAKVEAAGRAGIEKLKGSDEDLGDLYERYKQSVAEKQKQADERSPIASGMGKIGGALAPAMVTMGALGPAAGLGTEIVAQGTLGAAEGIGRSKAEDNKGLAEDAAWGFGLGAAGAPMGKAIGSGLGEVGEWGINKLKDNPLAKQLAATAINAAEIGKEKAGSLFGETGTGKLTQETRNLTEGLAGEIEAPIAAKNQEYTKAFKEAKEQGKLVPAPTKTGLSDIEEFAQDLYKNKIPSANDAMPAWTKENLESYKQGTLAPDIAEQMARELKNFKTTPFQGTLEQTKQNLLGSLTKQKNLSLDPETLAKLNKEKSAAWQASEPFIQKANKTIADPSFQPKSASQMSPEQRQLMVQGQLEHIVNDAGKSSVQGQKARNILQDPNNPNNLNETLRGINAEGNLGLKPDQMTQALQNQSYLSAANQNVAGVRGSEDTGFGLKDIARKVIGTPYKAAEMMSGSETVQNISKRLLAGSPEELSSIGAKLQQIPSTTHLGKALSDGVASGDRTKLNAAIFTILQNSNARKALTPSEGEPQ